MQLVQVTVEGDLNLQGMFALREDVAVGFNAFRTSIQIAGKASENALKEMAESGFKFSPMRNTVTQGIPMELNIQIGSPASGRL